MKILISTDWYPPTINGVVASVMNLKKELVAAGHDVRILTLSNSLLNKVEDNVYYVGSISAQKVYPSARLKIASAKKVVEEILEWNPDVIHTQCEFSTFLVSRKIAKKTGIPIVHTYHTIYEDYTHYFSPNQKFGRSVVAKLSQNTLNKAQAVIVPTEKVENILTGYDVTTPIHVIPTGIDISLYSKVLDDQKRKELKTKLNIPENDKVVVFLGRLAKEKNLEEIINYLSSAQIENLTFLLVGDGPYRKELEAFAAESKMSKKIIFAGMVPQTEAPYYYQLGDLFLSASNSETQGLTYIECLACGVPALCKEDECIDHVVINGENGWQYTDYDDFIKHLKLILSDDKLRKKMGQNGKKMVFEEFSTLVFSNRVTALYESVVSENKVFENKVFAN